MKITNPEGILSGALISALALFFIYSGWNLPLAGMSHMGPGMLPFIVALLMLAMGVILLVSGFAGDRLDRLMLPHWRPWFFVGIAPLVFASLIEQLGLAITIAVTVLVARMGVRHRLGWDVVLTPVLLSAGVVILFVYIMHLPFDPWIPR